MGCIVSARCAPDPDPDLIRRQPRAWLSHQQQSIEQLKTKINEYENNLTEQRQRLHQQQQRIDRMKTKPKIKENKFREQQRIDGMKTKLKIKENNFRERRQRLRPADEKQHLFLKSFGSQHETPTEDETRAPVQSV